LTPRLKILTLTLAILVLASTTVFAQEHAPDMPGSNAWFWTVIGSCGTAMSAAIGKLWLELKRARRETERAVAAERAEGRKALLAERAEQQRVHAAEKDSCHAEIGRLQSEIAGLHGLMAQEQRERRIELVKATAEKNDVFREVLTTLVPLKGTLDRINDILNGDTS